MCMRSARSIGAPTAVTELNCNHSSNNIETSFFYGAIAHLALLLLMAFLSEQIRIYKNIPC